MKITAEELGKMLRDSFHVDSWGTIEPEWFEDCCAFDEADELSGGGMKEVLERVCDQINSKFEMSPQDYRLNKE